MKAKISQIILWPKNRGKAPRVISFRGTGVEVITGGSQTGKSALISIVDYCLGGGKCTIPVRRIRDTVEWFGVLLRMPNARLLLARRNPGQQAETNEMYFDLGPKLRIPNSL